MQQSALSANLLVSSLQLLSWFVFRPTTWRTYIAGIDPTLRPDFSLVEIDRRLWRNAAFRRLLRRGYVMCPCLVASMVSLALWVWGEPGDTIAFGAGLLWSAATRRHCSWRDMSRL